MIYGIGTDIVDIERFEKKMTNNVALYAHIFSAKELAYCQQKHQPIIHFAARWAAKEAFLKAFGVSFIGNHKLTEISIENNEDDKPSFLLTGKTLEAFQHLQLKNIQVSLSHTTKNAIAFVVIEK